MARPAAELTSPDQPTAPLSATSCEPVSADTLAGLNVADDLKQAVASWVVWLSDERRMAALTIDAYRRDFSNFLAFVARHLGNQPALGDLGALSRADFRAWMAARSQRHLQASSTARALSAVKSFYRLAIRRGFIAETAITALRTPKLPRRLPKPLNAGEALEAEAGIGDTARAARNGKPEIPVLILTYRCGLRISEALRLRPGDVPRPVPADGAMPLLRITGKGDKTRMVPVLPVVTAAVQDYLAACPFGGTSTDPLFLGARGGPL